MGLVGIVTEQSKPTRLVLSVNVLGQGASLEIDSDLLEPEPVTIDAARPNSLI
jgi:hypothetical protein